MSSPKTAQQSSHYSASSLTRHRFDPLSDPEYTPEASPEGIHEAAKDERGLTLSRHAHTGAGDGAPINVLDLIGLIETVSAVPTIIPKTLWESIKFYSSGGTRRLYVYVNDSSGTGAWRHATLA